MNLKMIYRYFFMPRMGYIVGKETFFLIEKQGAARMKWFTPCHLTYFQKPRIAKIIIIAQISTLTGDWKEIFFLWLLAQEAVVWIESDRSFLVK